MGAIDWSEDCGHPAMYYYRPLAFFDGKVYKCAGHGAEMPSHRAFFEAYYNTPSSWPSYDTGHLPGVIITDGYKGDRIVVEDNKITEVL